MLKHKSIIGLRELVFGTLISVVAIPAFTALSTPAHAGDKDIAVAADKLNWVLFGEGPAELAVLWGDLESDEYAMLLKLPPGFTPGPHSHTATYHGVTVQGVWTHIFGDDDVRSLPTGSYVMQPGKELHNDACAGPGECILFIHQHGPLDFIPPEGAGN